MPNGVLVDSTQDHFVKARRQTANAERNSTRKNLDHPGIRPIRVANVKKSESQSERTKKIKKPQLCDKCCKILLLWFLRCKKIYVKCVKYSEVGCISFENLNFKHKYLKNGRKKTIYYYSEESSLAPSTYLNPEFGDSYSKVYPKFLLSKCSSCVGTLLK